MNRHLDQYKLTWTALGTSLVFPTKVEHIKPGLTGPAPTITMDANNGIIIARHGEIPYTLFSLGIDWAKSAAANIQLSAYGMSAISGDKMKILTRGEWTTASGTRTIYPVEWTTTEAEFCSEPVKLLEHQLAFKAKANAGGDDVVAYLSLGDV